MELQTLTYIVVGLTFALYIGIAIWARAATTGEFYVAGKGVHPVLNGMATGADCLRRVKYNHPGLVVDLGVGLWAWPMPMDYDSDGDLDIYIVDDGLERLLRNDGGGVFTNVASGVAQGGFR